MGKNRVRKSVIRIIANTLVHEIVVKHTHRPESSHFLTAEIIEYKSQAEKFSGEFNWNAEDKEGIERESHRNAEEILHRKYPDISYKEYELKEILKRILEEILKR